MTVIWRSSCRACLSSRDSYCLQLQGFLRHIQSVKILKSHTSALQNPEAKYRLRWRRRPAATILLSTPVVGRAHHALHEKAEASLLMSPRWDLSRRPIFVEASHVGSRVVHRLNLPRWSGVWIEAIFWSTTLLFPRSCCFSRFACGRSSLPCCDAQFCEDEGASLGLRGQPGTAQKGALKS